MPTQDAQLLNENRARIIIGDKPVTELNDMQFLRGRHPRGWPADSTFEDVAGLHTGGKVVIGNGQGYSTGSLALHESAHAVDFFTQRSQTPEFQSLHRAAYDRLNPYLQQGGPGGEAGSGETYAEVYSAYHVRGYGYAAELYGAPLADYIKGAYK